MYQLLPIERELLRRAEESITALARAIDSRAWHPNDPMLRDLERQLAEAQNSPSERQRHHEDERKRFYT